MFESLIFSAAMALVICLAAKPIARTLGVMDVPDGRRKLHARPTPEVGGIAVGLAVLPVIGWLAATTEFLPFFTTAAFAIAAYLLLGFADDRRPVRPLFRFVASLTIALAVVYVVPAERVTFFRFTFLEVAIFPDLWSAIAFTVFCIVGLQNAVNMADGKNGLAIGLLLTWSVLLTFYAPPHVMPVLTALIGALLVVFIFNLRGLLFLGDAGTYGLSVAVALLALHIYGVGFSGLHADVVALWFLIPIVDALRLMATRLLAGTSPFSADRRHFHHVLQAALSAWPSGGRLALYLGLVATPSALAIRYPEHTLTWALGALSVYTFMLVMAPLARSLAPAANLPANQQR